MTPQLATDPAYFEPLCEGIAQLRLLYTVRPSPKLTHGEATALPAVPDSKPGFVSRLASGLMSTVTDVTPPTATVCGALTP